MVPLFLDDLRLRLLRTENDGFEHIDRAVWCQMIMGLAVKTDGDATGASLMAKGRFQGDVLLELVLADQRLVSFDHSARSFAVAGTADTDNDLNHRPRPPHFIPIIVNVYEAWSNAKSLGLSGSDFVRSA
jgi:hypothetical protein